MAQSMTGNLCKNKLDDTSYIYFLFIKNRIRKELQKKKKCYPSANP